MSQRLLDNLWLLLLGVYIFAGMPIASYHGDESYHIYNSNDYAILFIERRPQDLLVHSLWETRLGYHRLLDSGVSRYTIGLAWHLAGMTRDDLPDSGYLWGESYESNVGRGLVPSPDALNIYRMPSTLFTALSIGIMFLIGKLYGGRPLAYFASGLYALNPIILLSGRRALQEGSLLFFGLLTIYVALVIAQKRERGTSVPLRWWVGLIVAGTLTQYSKNNGFIYIAAAYLAILIPEVLRLRSHAIAAITLRLGICTALTLLLFFAISPGLWYDPLARVRDVIDARTDAMQTQVDIDPNAPTTLGQRALDLIRQPFIMPVQHYELPPVQDSPALEAQVLNYSHSALGGLQGGVFLGGIFTLLAVIGLIANAIPRFRPHTSSALMFGLYVWLAANVVVLMATPLPWQRYYLSEIPVAVLALGIGVFSLIKVFHRATDAQPSYA